MKNDLVNVESELAEEPIVIADECGDSLWDAVLGQEVKAGQIVIFPKGQNLEKASFSH